MKFVAVILYISEEKMTQYTLSFVDCNLTPGASCWFVSVFIMFQGRNLKTRIDFAVRETLSDGNYPSYNNGTKNMSRTLQFYAQTNRP